MPADPLFVQLMIGPMGGRGEESFDLALIKRYVDDLLRDLERPTWAELAEQIGHLARWEFHDYRP